MKVRFFRTYRRPLVAILLTFLGTLYSFIAIQKARVHREEIGCGDAFGKIAIQWVIENYSPSHYTVECIHRSEHPIQGELFIAFYYRCDYSDSRKKYCCFFYVSQFPEENDPNHSDVFVRQFGNTGRVGTFFDRIIEGILWF